MLSDISTDSSLKELSRRGSFFCLLSGCLFIFSLVIWHFIPFEQQLNLTGIEGLLSFDETPGPFRLLWLFQMLFSLTFIGVVVIFHMFVREKNRFIMSWLSIMAISGFVILAMRAAHNLVYIPYLAHYFSQANDTTQPLLLLQSYWDFDYGILSNVLPGLWLFCSSLMALSHSKVPRGLVLCGIVVGGAFFINAVSIIIGIDILVRLFYKIGIVGVPVWCLWEAYFLYKLRD